MPFDHRWEALLDPGGATDFFADPAPPPRFDPEATGWNAAQAWWCSEVSRSMYCGDERRRQLYAPVGLSQRCSFADGSIRAALVAGSGFALVVFRGSADLRDWITNLRAAPEAWPRGGRVHRGFARALHRVWTGIEAELGAVDHPTFVTGHSLGGALATLAASRHAFAGAYTFGAPRVGDAAFQATLQSPLFRVVNDRDVVPTVPPRRMGYAHGGVLCELTDPRSPTGPAADDGDPPQAGADLAEDLRELARPADERRWFDPHPSLADHAPVNYTAHLALRCRDG